MSEQNNLFGSIPLDSNLSSTNSSAHEPSNNQNQSAVADDNIYLPLAEKMRPRELSDMVGQAHLIGEGTPLNRLYYQNKIHSMILWGPPGTGKTTLARMLANKIDSHWLTLSAVMSGVKEIREAIEKAKLYRMQGQNCVLFVDEVHRFNKSQQDAFLPHIEDGTIVFIGATTENPSFELNSALLSRAKVYVLKDLTDADLTVLLSTAASKHFADISFKDEVLAIMAKAAYGDARKALNVLESSVQLADNGVVDAALLEKTLGVSLARFDKGGDSFYEQISAFHKSLRGSDPDAALYWMFRMLKGGCDPFYIIRRMVCVASEDIGNADPKALTLALDTWNAVQRLGLPEGELAMAHAATYLASVPKSNASYMAMHKAKALAAETSHLPVPLHLRNATTSLQKDLDYGKAYHYSHDGEDAFSAKQHYFPDDLVDNGNVPRMYKPSERGFEKRLAQWLAYLRAKR